MRKAMQQEARGLPGTPLRHVRATVQASGHMPRAIPFSRRTRRKFIRPRGGGLAKPAPQMPSSKATWLTPPQGTIRQRMAVWGGRMASKLRQAVRRVTGR